MPAVGLERVYVWQAPLRLYHWVNVLAIVVLCATGYIIGAPPAFVIGREPSFSFWFGTVRFLHFSAGFVFLANFLIRIYWGFAGNEYSRWSRTLPITPRRWLSQWRDVRQVLRVDILQMRGDRRESLGHNALALWTYAGTFVLTVFQIATGFGLYAAMGPAWMGALFGWVVPLMGGDMAVRQWHHLAMWAFILFAMIHVYLVYYHETSSPRGVVSSMVSGWKYTERATDAERP